MTEHRYANLNKTFRHGYDPVGNRLLLTYPDGQTLSYAYNAANEQTSAVDSQAGAFHLEYDETGMRTVLAYPNGLTTHSTYDARDRVLSLVTTGEKTQSPDAQAPDFLYTYDPSGNRLTMDRSDEGLTTYTYDLKDQLTKAQFPRGAFQEFSYDPVGNRLKLQEVEHDSQLHTTDYTYNDANELLSLNQDFPPTPPQGPGFTDCPSAPAPDLLAGPGAPPSRWTTAFSYDGNGSRATKASDTGAATTYAWDPQERLLAVLEGKSIVQTNTYDPFARRASLTVNGATTAVLADATRSMNAALYEFTPGAKSQAPTRRLWIAGRLYASTTGSQPEFLLCDALGSVAATSAANVSLSSRTFYKPFGESYVRGAPRMQVSEPQYLGALGARKDLPTDLDYLWFRYLEAPIGAFIARDPLGRAIPGSDSYFYAKNEPVSRSDSSGLFTAADTPLTIACGGGATLCVILGGNPIACGAAAAACGLVVAAEAIEFIIEVASDAADNVCK